MIKNTQWHKLIKGKLKQWAVAVPSDTTQPEAAGSRGSSNYVPAWLGHPSTGQPTETVQTSPPGLEAWVWELDVRFGYVPRHCLRGNDYRPQGLKVAKKAQCLFSLFPSPAERLPVVAEVVPLTLIKDSGENKEEYVIDHLPKAESWKNSDVLALVNSPQRM